MQLVRLARSQLNIFNLYLSSVETSIPSESSIKVAKERRGRLRTTDASGQEDFISLSLTQRTEDQGPHPESRLMREDDELGEGDDGKYLCSIYLAAANWYQNLRNTQVHKKELLLAKNRGKWRLASVEML